MVSTGGDRERLTRGGGRMTPDGFLYELTGGELCLDFVNTGEGTPGPEKRELLARYADLVSWGEQAKAITPEEARALERVAARKPRDAEATLARARELRDLLFELFSASAAGRALPAGPLEALGPEVASALAHARLARGRGGGAILTFSDEPALDRVLWPVLRSAAELLTSDELARVRQCASDSCDWLFVDRSKNASRRWCDMTTCGNRDKVRRHRERARED